MSERRGPGLLLAIAIFKLAKSSALAALGVCGLLLARDGHVYATLAHVMNELRLDPDNHYAHRAISKVSGLSTRRLEELSLGTFVYAVVFLTEGGGLLLRKRWAEYLTTIVTASFVPFEVYELVHQPSILKAAGLALNLAIVGYLAWGLVSKSAPGKKPR